MSGVLQVSRPEGPILPLVIDSPHSGLIMPPDFAPAAPRAALLTTCDRYVDELWSDAPSLGAPVLAALFPRAYIDPNRAETDIDPDLLSRPWTGPVRATDYSRRGMGLIRRNALPGVPMYDAPLRPEDVQRRLERYYRPYRTALGGLLDEAAAGAGGSVWHLNCHSMKSRGNAMNTDAGQPRCDFVLSDRRGITCGPDFTVFLAETLVGRGYSVSVNDPYQGGDLVATCGRPAEGRHSLQVEVNRALYLDEATYEKSAAFDALRHDLGQVTAALAGFVRQAQRR